MDRRQRNIRSHCTHQTVQTLIRIPCARSILWDTLPGIRRSRNAYIRRKEKPSETDFACRKFAALKLAAVPETSHAAKSNVRELLCCRTKARSTPNRLQELRSIPYRQ